MFVARALHCIIIESEKRALNLCSATLMSRNIAFKKLLNEVVAKIK